MRRSAVLVVLLLAALVTGSLAQELDEGTDANAEPSRAPAEGIVSRVEIFRVDRNGDDGSERFTPVSEALPGDVVEYRLHVRNESGTDHGPGRVVVSVPIPEMVAYVPDSAGPPDEERVLIEFSVDGGETYATPPVLIEEDGVRTTVPPADYDHVRWTLVVPLEAGAEETLYYRVEVR